MDASDNATSDEAMTVVGTDPKTGFATDGEWPINLRLRAEAMADKGVKSDPNGMIDDDLIAATKTRMVAEAKEAAREAKETPSMDWTKAQLTDEAEARGLAIESDANKAAILDAINAAPPAQTEA